MEGRGEQGPGDRRSKGVTPSSLNCPAPFTPQEGPGLFTAETSHPQGVFHRLGKDCTAGWSPSDAQMNECTEEEEQETDGR